MRKSKKHAGEIPLSDEKVQTVGQAALDLQKKDEIIHAVELERAIHKGNKSADSWESQLMECLQRGMSRYEGDFYLTVITKKERLLENVVRRYFIDRESCPTPEFDQTVFRYVKKDDALKYLWTVPDIQACHELYINAADVSDELKPLVSMVLDFRSGRLDRIALQLNGEEPTTPL